MTAGKRDPLYILWMLFLVFILVAGIAFLYAGIVEHQQKVFLESLERALGQPAAWRL